MPEVRRQGGAVRKPRCGCGLGGAASTVRACGKARGILLCCSFFTSDVRRTEFGPDRPLPAPAGASGSPGASLRLPLSFIRFETAIQSL